MQSDELDFVEGVDLLDNNGGIALLGQLFFVDGLVGWGLPGEGVLEVAKLSPDDAWTVSALHGGSLLDDDSWQGFWKETHTDDEGPTDDDVDDEDPLVAQLGVFGNGLTDDTADGRACVGREDKQSHRLGGLVGGAEQVSNGTGDVGQGGGAAHADDEHEDGHHRHVEGPRAAEVEDDVEDDRDDVDPLSAAQVGQRPEERRPDSGTENEQGLAESGHLGVDTEVLLHNVLDGDVGRRRERHVHLQRAVRNDDTVLLFPVPVVWVVWVLHREGHAGLNRVRRDVC